MGALKVIVLIDDSAECTIITSDGGLASTHHNGNHLLTTYYQNRIQTPMKSLEAEFSKMETSKQFNGDWNGGNRLNDLPEKHEHDTEVYEDAAGWLGIYTEIKTYSASDVEDREINHFITTGEFPKPHTTNIPLEVDVSNILHPALASLIPKLNVEIKHAIPNRESEWKITLVGNSAQLTHKVYLTEEDIKSEDYFSQVERCRKSDKYYIWKAI